MKRLFFLGVVLVLFFASCFRELYDYGEERVEAPDVPNQTFVQFQNLSNQKVRVFSYFDRNTGSVIADIPPNGTSKQIDWFPTTERTSFYLRYLLGISSIEIPYNPTDPLVRGTIRRNETTLIQIPPPGSVPPVTGNLVNTVYFVIKNDSYQLFTLQLGSTRPPNISGSTTNIDPGSTGAYVVNPGATTNYHLTAGSVYDIPIPVPEDTAIAGHIYSFSFDGTDVVFISATPITRENFQ